MTIATLPPSTHVAALRSFIERIRRTRTIPGQQEFAHAIESLQALGDALSSPKSQQTGPMLTADDIIKQREEW